MPREPRPVPGPNSSVEERVSYITWLMSRGEWHCWASRKPLIEVWGITDDRCRQLAAEANRRLALDAEDLAQMRASHAAWCMRLRKRAARMRNQATGLPDFASALKAVELAAKFQGIDLEPKPQTPSAEARRIEIVLLPEPETPEPKPHE